MQHNSTPSGTLREIDIPLSRDELGQLFWDSRDALIVGDQQRGILYWNPAAEDIYGYTADEAIGQPFDILVPPEARSEFEALTESFGPGNGDMGASAAPIEMPALHKSGRRIFVEFSVSVFSHNGQPYGIATIRDCTERKRLEKERDDLLAQAQETIRRAEELARLKADLSSLIAHEIGNPLAAMGAVLDLLDRDDLQPDQRKDLRASLRGEVTMMQRLVEDIRSAAHMESGQFSNHPEPTDLEDILTDATIASQPLLSDHDFIVEPIPDVMVQADRDRISQVLRNLLSNAAKYTPPGTRVVVRTTRLDGQVRITVEDNGPGIAPEDLTHIFTKFGRGRDTAGERIPGRGLGLYLSRQIIIQHGGDLVATSDPGVRTTFCFELNEAS